METDTSWGIDHGTYSVLAHIFPAADIPIVQLSIDRRKTPHEHDRLAKRVASLRDEGHRMPSHLRGLRDMNCTYSTYFQEHDHASAIDYRRRRLARVCLQPVLLPLADEVDANARNFLAGLRSDANASV